MDPVTSNLKISGNDIEQPPRIKMLINGKLVESGSTHWEDIPNPATQEILARGNISRWDRRKRWSLCSQA